MYNFYLCKKVARDRFVFNLWTCLVGLPPLPLRCGKFIICTWVKMTYNYLFNLRNDTKKKIHLKYHPYLFLLRLNGYWTLLCTVKIWLILPHFDITLPLSLQRDHPQDRVQSVSNMSPSCQSVAPHLPYMSFWHTFTYRLHYFLLTCTVGTPVISCCFVSDSQAPHITLWDIHALYKNQGMTPYHHKVITYNQFTYF